MEEEEQDHVQKRKLDTVWDYKARTLYSFSTFSIVTLCSFPVWSVRFLFSSHRHYRDERVTGCEVPKVPGEWRTYSTLCYGELFCVTSLSSDVHSNPCSSNTQGL